MFKPFDTLGGPNECKPFSKSYPLLRLKSLLMATLIAPSLIGPPKACEAAPRTVSGEPHIELAPPYKPEAGREGRFFEIRILPSGVWRCILKINSKGIVSFRDFGYTDEDYLRAWEFGNEWANS